MILVLGIVQPFVVILVLASAFVFLYMRATRHKVPFPLPPGPPGHPLIGNLGQLSNDHPELNYIKWGKEYQSDVIYTNILSQPMICLNSVKACTELLDQRGSNYCDRPRFTLFEIMGWGRTLTFLPWGSRFKLHRRLFQNTFTQSNIRTFQPIQLHESQKAVKSLLKTPESWSEVTLLLTTSIIFRIAFGQEVTDWDSRYCDMARAANEVTTNGGIAGSTLVDLFPPARFLPDWLNPSAALRHARSSRSAIHTIHNEPWAATVRQLAAGTAETSFMKTHWEKYHEYDKTRIPQEMTLEDVQGAAGAVFIAGGNSTHGSVVSVMLFLTRHQAEQRKVQAELDGLLVDSEGQSRLPTFEDRPRLRRLHDFIMETMRCLPLNPLVIPHRSLRDDVYRGMLIPAGTTVFTNTTAINTDPVVYRDPECFDPDRYVRGEPYPPGNFGFGRRRCPGNWLALASVYMFVATMLSVFDLDMTKDEKGRPIVPQPGLRVGLGGSPTPFHCHLKVRSPERARLLMLQET